jgi:hypothetical protein
LIAGGYMFILEIEKLENSSKSCNVKIESVSNSIKEMQNEIIYIGESLSLTEAHIDVLEKYLR